MSKSTLYLTIFASELRVIAGITAMTGQTETGGELWGLFSHGRQPRIYLAGPPGPAATHQQAHFAQDLEFCRRMSRVLERQQGLQLDGSWHSHHRMQLNSPSGGDLAQVRSITTRNGFETWCEIIATIEHRRPAGRWLGGRRRPSGHRAEEVIVKLNAFVYPDPQRGQGIPVPIRMIPGISPVRWALLGRGEIDAADIGGSAAWFPLDRIVYESHRLQGQGAEPAPQLPDALAAQIQDLPLVVQKGLTVHFEDRLVTLRLPLANGQSAAIAFDAEEPHEVRAVYWQSSEGQRAHDISNTILGRKKAVTLASVYRKLLAARRKEPPWKRASTDGVDARV